MKERSKASAFVERDWSLFDRTSAAHWKELAEQRGAAAMWEIGDALREHAMHQNPDWPTERDRALDRENHLNVMKILALVPARGR